LGGFAIMQGAPNIQYIVKVRIGLFIRHLP
jgi:hypothetical protein